MLSQTCPAGRSCYESPSFHCWGSRIGLDGALRYLTTLPTGVWPLFFMAGGFIAHGLYQGCRAVYMRR
jgi:Domain of Unknown Function (DUF1206).